jgi:hypothetical protein
MNKHLRILIAVYISACGQGAMAGPEITSIGPFAGDFSEGFETYGAIEIPGPQKNLSGPLDILAGHATLTGVHPDQVRPLIIWSSLGGYSLDDKGVGNVRAVPFDGTRGLGLNSSVHIPVARIDFHIPIRDFGGYWVHAITQTMSGPILVNMFGAGDVPVGTAQFNYDYANLQGISQWFGWTSTVPVHAITFSGFWAGVDGIQVNVIPEPATFVLTLFGAMMFGMATLRSR